MTTQYSVLIIEDNAEDLTAMRSTAIALGWHVESAGTIERALAKLRDSKFNMAIVDLNLPDSRGMETLTRIQEAHAESIVVVSGNLGCGVGDAVALSRVPYIEKENGWIDEVTTELREYGKKGGIPARPREDESTASCDDHWRQSVTGMFVALQKSIDRVDTKVDRLESGIVGDVAKLKRRVFGHDDQETGRHIEGCADFCDTFRDGHKRVTAWAWGTVGTGIGAAAMWALTEMGRRIANG